MLSPLTRHSDWRSCLAHPSSLHGGIDVFHGGGLFQGDGQVNHGHVDGGHAQRHAGQLAFILNTVAVPHQLDTYLQLLKRDGTMTLVGAPAEPTEADDEPWQDAPQSGHRAWVAAFAGAAGAIATLPAIAAAAGAAVLWPVVRDATTLAEAIRAGLPWLPVAALTGYATLGALVLVLVRGLAPAISPGLLRAT